MSEQFKRIIKGMQCCQRVNNTNLCGDCPYRDGRNTVFGCMLSLIRDAQFIIKRQQERIRELEEELGQRDYNAAGEMQQYCERYEPTYNPDDGSM